MFDPLPRAIVAVHYIYDAINLADLLTEHGYCWRDGCNFTEEPISEDICIRIESDNNHIVRGSYDFYKYDWILENDMAADRFLINVADYIDLANNKSCSKFDTTSLQILL